MKSKKIDQTLVKIVGYLITIAVMLGLVWLIKFLIQAIL